MPFFYELTIAAGEPPFTFVQQLVPVGQLVGTGQPVATLTNGVMEYHVPAPRQGLLVAWFIAHGAPVEPGDVLARIVCEGDEVPVENAVPMRLG